jgi:hypothetical protein
VIIVVEYSLQQLLVVTGSIMDFCENQRFSKQEIEQLRVVLENPSGDGRIAFSIGLPA